jgi:hypothetical protein
MHERATRAGAWQPCARSRPTMLPRVLHLATRPTPCHRRRAAPERPLHLAPLHSVRSLCFLSRLARAHAMVAVAAIAELGKPHATASRSILMLNGLHHHRRRAMPRAPHPFSGRDRRRRPLPPGRRRRHRLLSWLRHHGPPWAEPGAPVRARRSPCPRAALSHRRR